MKFSYASDVREAGVAASAQRGAPPGLRGQQYYGRGPSGGGSYPPIQEENDEGGGFEMTRTNLQQQQQPARRELINYSDVSLLNQSAVAEAEQQLLDSLRPPAARKVVVDKEKEFLSVSDY